LIEKYAKECSMPYVNIRWVGGILTNYGAIKHAIQRYIDLNRGRDGGDWEKYTKKERSELQKEVERLHDMVDGLVTMKQLPKAMFVVDINTERTAVKEAHVVHVPVVAVCDTNTNPTDITCVIPANDDATRGLELMIKAISQACAEGLKNRKVVAAPEKKTVMPFAPRPAVAAKPAAAKAAPVKAAAEKKVAEPVVEGAKKAPAKKAPRAKKAKAE